MQCPVVDELVFNDFGAMRYLHRHYPQYPLTAGRLMDKGMREARFDVYSELEEVRNNRRMMESTNFNAPFCHSLFRQYSMSCCYR